MTSLGCPSFLTMIVDEGSIHDPKGFNIRTQMVFKRWLIQIFRYSFVRFRDLKTH